MNTSIQVLDFECFIVITVPKIETAKVALIMVSALFWKHRT